MLSLLEEAGVVELPSVDGFVSSQGGHGVTRRLAPNVAIAPRRVYKEVLQPLVSGVDTRWIGARTGRDRFHTLALAVPQKAQRIRREGSLPAGVPKDAAQGVEVLGEPTLPVTVEEKLHDQ